MSLPRFELFQPQTLEEACGLLARYPAGEAAILAGGTDLLVNIKRAIIPAHLPRCAGCGPQTGKPLMMVDKTPQCLIALSKIDDLKGIKEEDQGISIGSLTTITQICKSGLIRNKLTALAEGGDNLGSPLVRNRATIGGNICNARPAADMLIPTYALKGILELISPKGKRTIPVEDFITGPGKTIIYSNEILTKIHFPLPGRKSGSSAIKLANRKALEIALVNAAGVLTLDQENRIAQVRIALGAVAPRPIIANRAMEFLLGKEPRKEVFIQAGQIAAAECQPITDHRGSALYRIEMVKVLVKRTLMKTAERAEMEIQI